MRFDSPKSRLLRSRVRLAVVAVAVLASALLVAACGGSDSTDGSGSSSSTANAPAGSGETGGTLNLVTSLTPVSIDPAKIEADPQSTWFTELAYEPLIRTGPDGEPEPALATSWRYVGTGNKQFELKLRPGVEFADGTPVTAEAVAASLEYWLKNGVNSPAWAGPATKVTAVDEQTVTIDFNAPYPVAEQIFTDIRQAGNIISPAGLKDPQALGNQTFGAGPYELDPDQTVSGDHYTFVPNPNYWDKEKVNYEEVVIKVIVDPSSALQAVRTGQADLMFGNATSIPTAEAAGLQIVKAPSAVEGIVLADREGTMVPALKDVRVRQALNYAVNREQVVEALFPEAGTATAQTSAPDLADFVPALDTLYPYDPEKAEELLAEAGYPDGFDLPLATPTTFDLPKLVQAVASEWEKVGVKTDITTVPDINKWFEETQAAKYPTYILYYSFLPPYFKANSLYTTANIWNAFDTKDPKLAALVSEASAEEDVAKQDQLWKEASEYYAEQAWAVPVVRADGVFIASPDIAGVEFSAASLTPNALGIEPAAG